MSNILLGKKVHEISHLSEFIMRYPTGIKHTYITLYLSLGVLPQTKETVSAVSYYELLLLNPFSHLKSLYFEWYTFWALEYICKTSSCGNKTKFTCLSTSAPCTQDGFQLPKRSIQTACTNLSLCSCLLCSHVVDVSCTKTVQPYVNISLVVPNVLNKSEGALNLPCKLYTTDSAEL